MMKTWTRIAATVAAIAKGSIIGVHAKVDCTFFNTDMEVFEKPTSTHIGKKIHMRLYRTIESPSYQEVTSDNCEARGLNTITSSEECKRAASKVGRNVVWGPHGGYPDVVDGCSARFSKSSSHLFHNPNGKCDPNVNKNPPTWTYTGCKCTSGQPCMCSKSIHQPDFRTGNDLVLGDCVIPDPEGNSAYTKTVSCDENDSSQLWTIDGITTINGKQYYYLKNGKYWMKENGITPTKTFFHMKHFRPHVCMCHSKPAKRSSAPNSDGTIYHDPVCVDIDECKYPDQYKCPANSDCLNKNAGYNCECHDGFAIKNNFPIKIGNPSSICAPMGISASVIPTSTTASYVITPQDLQIKRFNIIVNLVDRFNQVYPIEEYIGVDKVGTLLSLQPGTRYEIDVTGINTLGNEVGAGKGFGTAFTTPCNCDSNPDPSGSPTELQLFQNRGFVTFEFTDASMCESAYSFSRQAIEPNQKSKTEIFTQDYFYYSKDPCDEVYRPGRRSADNLFESDLVVGKTYNYCIRAVGSDGYSSEDSCIKHKIAWEASIAGFVRLSVEAGSLPVDDVIVKYSFDTGDFFLNGTTKTNEDGKFKIPIKAIDTNGNHPNPPMENSKLYPVQLSFYKTTMGENSTFTHKFLCEGGSTPCEQSNSDVYLSHLAFDTPIEIIDDSTVDIRGKVLIDGTYCGVHNAKICVIDHFARTTGERNNCIESEQDGSFSIGAVIGTRVTLEVDYFNHTFALNHPTFADANINGFVIDPNIDYDGFIFRDVQKNTMKVEVFGGECRRFLGKSEITYTIKGCNTLDPDKVFGDLKIDYDKASLSADHFSVYAEYLVPAHVLEVFSTIYENLETPVQRIDMREIATSSESPNEGIDRTNKVMANVPTDENDLLKKEEEKDDEKSDPFLLMFKFDGTIRLDTHIGSQKCMQQDFQDTPRFKVFERSKTNVTVEVLETFPNRKDGTPVEPCDVFEDGLQVWFKNELGYMGGEDDDKYLDSLSTDLERFAHTVCSDGCFFDLQYDKDPITKEKSRAHRKQEFFVGPPFLNEPYVRYFTAEIVRNSVMTNLVTEALVLGSYNKGQIDKVGLPTHEPLLVLRDPPGGMSFATYQNIESKVYINMDQFERHIDASRFHQETLTGDLAIEPCVGGGFGLISLLCEKFGVEIFGKFNHETHLDFVSRHDKDAFTASFTTTWSYSTSSDPFTAGNDSDVFVVPTLNVVFYRVEKVIEQGDTCLGFLKEDVAFDANDNDNQGVSFYTKRDILNFELPDYINRLSVFETKIKEGSIDCQSNSNGPQARFYCESRNQVDQAIKSWTRFLAEYEQTNTDALDGKYEENVVRVNEWFNNVITHNQISNLDGNNIYEKSGATKSQFNTGLLPNSLIESANLVKEGEVEGEEDLGTIKYISFTGGGSMSSFTVQESKKKEQERKDGAPKDNLKTSFEIDFAFRKDIHSGKAELRTDFGPKFSTTGVNVRYQTNIHSQDSSVGFTLGDENVGDKFDIQVAIDKKYGTFIFTTLPSSRSKCPHEKGTVKRVDPFMRILEYPAPLVLPDEPMVFKVELSNLGEDRSNFEVYSDQRANSDSLSFPGSFYPKPIDFLDGGEAMTLTVPVRRGPTEYQYDPIPLTLRSPCEFSQGDGNMFGIPEEDRTQYTIHLYNNKQNKTIEFAEPCPAVTLLKPSTKDTFVVSSEEIDSNRIRVVVRNPQVSILGSFFNQKINPSSRLDTVQLKFLDKSRNKINSATTYKMIDGENTSLEIDFSSEMGNEDELGFAVIEWNIENDQLSDGEYEFWVETQCNEFLGAHSSFNRYESDHVNLIVDRKRPKLFGLPNSAADMIYPGEEIVFEFTEDLDCGNYFELVVTVEGMETTFDNKVDGNDNLLVVCDGSEIRFQFDITNTKFDDLLGKSFHVELIGVADLSGNKMKMGSLQYDMKFGDFDVRNVGTRFDVSLPNKGCQSNENNVEEFEKEIEELLQLTHDEAKRIHVLSVTCSNSEDGSMQTFIEIDSPDSKQTGPDRRLGLVASDERPSTDIYYDLLSDQSKLNQKKNFGSASIVSNLEVIMPRTKKESRVAVSELTAYKNPKLIEEKIEVNHINDLKDLMVKLLVLIIGIFVGIALLLLRK